MPIQTFRCIAHSRSIQRRTVLFNLLCLFMNDITMIPSSSSPNTRNVTRQSRVCAFLIHVKAILSVKSMSSERKPITPNPPRWKPNPDPASIVIPGLDTEASTTDQIEQIEQLITIKLQVRLGWSKCLAAIRANVLVRTSMRTFLKSIMCWRTSSFLL